MGKRNRNVAWVVLKGRKPGIYFSWEECKRETHGFKGSKHHAYESVDVAQATWDNWQRASLSLTPAVGTTTKGISVSNTRHNVGLPRAAVYLDSAKQHGLNALGPHSNFYHSGHFYPSEDAMRHLSTIQYHKGSVAVNGKAPNLPDDHYFQVPDLRRVPSVTGALPAKQTLQGGGPPIGTKRDYSAMSIPGLELVSTIEPQGVKRQKIELELEPRDVLVNVPAYEGVKREAVLGTLTPQTSFSSELDGDAASCDFDAETREETFSEPPVVLTPAQQAVEILRQLEVKYSSGKQRKTDHEDGYGGSSEFPAVQVVAPTGIAALPLGGKTTYSFAGWNMDSFLMPLEDLLGSTKQRFFKQMLSLRVLIIEEISMVENQFLQRLNALMQYAASKEAKLEAMAHLPFAGKQVILLGDFHQLPPVKPFSECFGCGEPMSNQQVAPSCIRGDCQLRGRVFQLGDKWAFKAPVWKELNLRHVKLQQIHRQVDTSFQALLNKIRNGDALTQSEWCSLSAPKPLPPNAFPIRLMSRVMKVKEFNESQLAALPHQARNWRAADLVWKAYKSKGDEFRYNDIARQREEHKKTLQDHRWSTNLTLKVGAKVVPLHNLSHDRGLVNGSQGTVVKLVDSEGWPLYFSGSNDEARKRQLVKTHQALNGYLCPVVRFANGRTETIRPLPAMSLRGPSWDRYVVCRTQIPLGLAWALSIHKSQGMTLAYVEVSSKDIFESGQLYVGVSRAQTLEGLTVTGFNKKQIAIDAEVLKFYGDTEWVDLGEDSTWLKATQDA